MTGAFFKQVRMTAMTDVAAAFRQPSKRSQFAELHGLLVEMDLVWLRHQNDQRKGNESVEGGDGDRGDGDDAAREKPINWN